MQSDLHSTMGALALGCHARTFDTASKEVRSCKDRQTGKSKKKEQEIILPCNNFPSSGIKKSRLASNLALWKLEQQVLVLTTTNTVGLVCNDAKGSNLVIVCCFCMDKDAACQVRDGSQLWFTRVQDTVYAKRKRGSKPRKINLKGEGPETKVALKESNDRMIIFRVWVLPPSSLSRPYNPLRTINTPTPTPRFFSYPWHRYKEAPVSFFRFPSLLVHSSSLLILQ